MENPDKVTRTKAYKFRIYPAPEQKVLLSKTFGCVRRAWNSWAENFNKPKGEERVFKTPKEFRKELEWMKEVSAAAIQQKERDFSKFKEQFFNKKSKKKVGRPVFKSRRGPQKFRLPNQKFSVSKEANRIRLEKIGWIKTIFDRGIPDDVKYLSASVSKDTVGDYYVSITVEEEIEEKERTGKAVGVDVGLTSFAVFSDGTEIENPRFFRENQSELRRAQKHLCRKKKGSNRRRRARVKVAKIHRKTARQRDLFLHSLSSYLVRTYDLIAIEDLNVSGMLKNRHLSKSIADASWSELSRQLEYKCDWYGKELKKAGRFEPTSKKCSTCGWVNKDLTLSDRVWSCKGCGSLHDRDVNAAVNILKSVRVAAELQTWSDCKTILDPFKVAGCCEASRVM